jgi:hypothetical protein
MNEFRDSFASILRFCTDFAIECRGLGYDIEVMNLDAAGAPNEWPSKDVIGPAEFTFTLDDGNIVLSTMIAVSTVEDTNNFRLNDILNRLLNKLIPGMRVKLLNSSSGATRGFLVVTNGTRVTPPERSGTRAIQPIMISLLSDQTLRG